MFQLIVVASAAVGLIALVAFIAARLLRARSSGMSIRMQVFLALASIVGAFAFGLGLLVLDRIKARAELVGREAALGEARTVAAIVAAELETDGRTLDDVATRFVRAPQASTQDGELGPHLALLTRDGAVVFASGRSPEEPGTVTVKVPIVVYGAIAGYTRVVKPTLLIKKTLADFAPTILVISLALGAVAAVAASLIGRTIARPIEELTRFATSVSEGERRAAPPLGHGREVMLLSRALDSMRRQLEGRPFVETFAADLSHELKNPVAAIRASAEVLTDGALDEPEEARRFVARILEATARIEALLADLLRLARLEARGLEDIGTVELSRCAQTAIDAVLAYAADRSADLLFRSTDDDHVRGDAASLARAIENLLDNAIVHGDPGPVEVTIERIGRDVRCRVSSRGAIAKGVRPRIFRRFVTTRAARGGTGLGLAIVKAVAEAHGGDVVCAELGPPTVEFTLTLPAA
ncbi:MAG: HAMP domain-containing protein [Myxococcales bacterium]|nr:HAMP domain-containing protein [Myxococcales bacterium]